MRGHHDLQHHSWWPQWTHRPGKNRPITCQDVETLLAGFFRCVYCGVVVNKFTQHFGSIQMLGYQKERMLGVLKVIFESWTFEGQKKLNPATIILWSFPSVILQLGEISTLPQWPQKNKKSGLAFRPGLSDSKPWKSTSRPSPRQGHWQRQRGHHLNITPHGQQCRPRTDKNDLLESCAAAATRTRTRTTTKKKEKNTSKISCKSPSLKWTQQNHHETLCFV